MNVKILFLTVIVVLLSACGAKPYVDVKSDDSATLQLIPKSKTLLFTDAYYAFVTDFSHGCDYDYDRDYLGIFETNSDTPSRKIKIPSEKPLIIDAKYKVTSGNSVYIEYFSFLLTPQKNKDYVVEYTKKSLGLFKDISDFYVYEKSGDKEIKVPSSRIRNFNFKKECGK